MNITTFKTVTSIGKEATEKALKEFKVSSWAQELLDKTEYTTGVEYNLVKMTVGELGFYDGATTEQIYAKAKEQGLELCPAEIGPLLRIQWKDQPESNWWTKIAMEPITAPGGDLGVFNVERNGRGLWLYARDGYPQDFWDASDVWLFRRQVTSSQHLEPSPQNLDTQSLELRKVLALERIAEALAKPQKKVNKK